MNVGEVFRVHFSRICLMLMVGLGLLGCTENQPPSQVGIQTDSVEVFVDPVTPAPPLPANQDNFLSFLKFFRKSDSFLHWPDSVQIRLMDDADFYTPGKEEALVNRILKRIPIQYEAYLPIEAIRNYDDYLPTKVPQESYHFYAYERVEFDSFWLMSIFAFKEPYKEGEYHQHHFFATTYSKKGQVLDEFNWWTFIYDDLQIPAQTSAVWGDTMVGGHMGRISSRVFNDIFLKVVLRPTGRFDTVYYSPPEPSMF